MFGTLAEGAVRWTQHHPDISSPSPEGLYSEQGCTMRPAGEGSQDSLILFTSTCLYLRDFKSLSFGITKTLAKRRKEMGDGAACWEDENSNGVPQLEMLEMGSPLFSSPLSHPPHPSPHCLAHPRSPPSPVEELDRLDSSSRAVQPVIGDCPDQVPLQELWIPQTTLAKTHFTVLWPPGAAV
jgi:hypothetical protein